MIAVEAAWRRWYPLAREKARRLLGSGGDADDVAQEVFLRFWREGMAEAPTRTASAWLYKTTTRLSIDRLRELRSRNDHEAALGDLPAAGAPDEQLAVRQELQGIAESVPVAELEVAILHRVDRLDQGEIAEVVGITTRTVRRLLGRFDRRLAELRGGGAR